MERKGNCHELPSTILYNSPRSHIHVAKIMTKPYDDSNWRQEYKSYVSDKFKLKLLEEGPHSLAQAWVLGAMYSEWKRIKGYNKYDPVPNEGQNQSSLKEFFERYKDQGI